MRARRAARWCSYVGVLVFLAICVTWAIAGDIKDEEIDYPFVFKNEHGNALCDTANGRVLIYPQTGDSAGVGIYLIFDNSDSSSSWTFDSVMIGGNWRAFHYDDHGLTQVLANRLLLGADSPDGFITRYQTLLANVVHAFAIADTSVQPRHICPDSFYVMGIDSGSVISIYAIPATVLLESEWPSWFEPSFDDSLATGTYDADFDTLTADSLWAAEACIDSLWPADSIATWIHAARADSLDIGTLTGVSQDDVPDGSSYERVAAAEVASGIYKDATTTDKGIASFSATDFDVSSGAVSGDATNTKDSEWDTASEINAATTDEDFLTTRTTATIDTSRAGTTTMPDSPTVTWYTWKSGATIGCWIDWRWTTGSPPYYNNLGEVYTYAITAECTEAGKITWTRAYTTTASGGNKGISYKIEYR